MAQKQQQLSQEKQKQLKNIAVQAKRQLTIQNRKEHIKNDLQECPAMLSLSQLASKANLPYMFVRKMVIEENIVPYFKIGKKYIVNYNLFLETLNKKEV